MARVGKTIGLLSSITGLLFASLLLNNVYEVLRVAEGFSDGLGGFGRELMSLTGADESLESLLAAAWLAVLGSVAMVLCCVGMIRTKAKPFGFAVMGLAIVVSIAVANLVTTEWNFLVYACITSMALALAGGVMSTLIPKE